MYNIGVKVKGVCMKIQSIDNQNFQARQDKELGAYNPRKNRRHNVDTIIALDDNYIRQIAYAKTVATVEDKKHRKITNGMFLSIPFVAGLATALLSPSKSVVLGKQISGVAGRMVNGAGSAASWGVLLGLATAVNSAFGIAEKKSPEVRKFTRENPVITFIGQIGAFIGTVALGGKYLPKMVNGIANHIKPQSLEKIANKVVRGANGLNNSKVTKKAVNMAQNFANNKYFEPLKSVAKTALNWAPSLLLWGGVLHSINHNNVKQSEFVKNYSEMKDYQARLAKARIAELSDEREFVPRMDAHQA